MDLGEVNSAISLLAHRKQRLEQGSKVAHASLLKYFLEEVKARKERVRGHMGERSWGEEGVMRRKIRMRGHGLRRSRVGKKG